VPLLPPHHPSDEEVMRTVRLERLRAVAMGIFESAPSTFLLLILVRWFNGSNAEKSLLAGAYQAGLLITPLILYATRFFGRAPSQAMAILFLLASVAYGWAACTAEKLSFVALTSMGSLIVAATTPLMTTVMNSNYPATRRGFIYAQNNSIRLATSIIFSTTTGWAISGRLEHYPLLVGIYAAALAMSASLLWKVPRCGGPLTARPLLGCFKHIKNDKLLRDTLIAWMFLGFGNLMMVPLRIEYLANTRYHLNLSEVEIALLVSTLPLIARLLVSPLWGSLFDRLNFFSLRIAINTCYLLSVLSFFSSSNPLQLGIAALLFGISASGGDVAWNLWVTKFAPHELVPDYMVVHTFFTGVRGLLAPFVAFTLLDVLPLTTLMWISAGFMAIATFQVFFIREGAGQNPPKGPRIS